MMNRALAAAMALMLAGNSAWAETIVVQVKTPDGTPMPGETVTFSVAAGNTLLDTGITDAAGKVTFIDNAFVGQNRCYLVAQKPNWVIGYTGSQPPIFGTYYGSNSVCSPAISLVHFYGQRLIGNGVRVVGGANGYVNPNRDETAKMIFVPAIPGDVTVNIYTSRGKLVASKTEAVIARVQNEIAWDGRSADGQIVASGIYIAHLSGAGISATKKFAVVRN